VVVVVGRGWHEALHAPSSGDSQASSLPGSPQVDAVAVNAAPRAFLGFAIERSGELQSTARIATMMAGMERTGHHARQPGGNRLGLGTRRAKPALDILWADMQPSKRVGALHGVPSSHGVHQQFADAASCGQHCRLSWMLSSLHETTVLSPTNKRWRH
jgi:hypothetical protein